MTTKSNIIIVSSFLNHTEINDPFIQFITNMNCDCVLFYSEINSNYIQLSTYFSINFPHIVLLPLDNVSNLVNYSENYNEYNYMLPMNRGSVDTYDYIMNSHAKVACMNYVVNYIFTNTPSAYIWLDSEITSLLTSQEQVEASIFMKHLANRATLNIPDKMILVGSGEESQPVIDENRLISDVCWRFFSKMIIGNHVSIRNFWKLYENYFLMFLIKYKTLVWSVNFWAWLETNKLFSPIRYSAKFNYTIFANLPKHLYSDNLSLKQSFTQYSIPLMSIIDDNSIYHGSSASYYITGNKHYLNMRYLNYYINDDNSYRFSNINNLDNMIRSKNMLYELDSDTLYVIKTNEESNFGIMMDESNIGLLSTSNFSQGIEDIRLYYQDSKNKANPYFIGSTINYSSNDKIEIIMGKYNIDTASLSDGRIVTTPNNNFVEKNWAPILGTDKFIYSWTPYIIGQYDIVNSSTEQQLTLIPQKLDKLSLDYSMIRGSSVFIPVITENVTNYIGVVHSSEDSYGSLRKYYHRLIQLDENYIPIKTSNLFYFINNSIEFCIGFSIKNDKYVFWISQCDTTPLMVTIDKYDIELWNL